MIAFTTVVGVDRDHLAEWRLTWPTWKRHHRLLLDHPLLVVCDGDRSVADWQQSLQFLGHPQLRVTTWTQVGVTQREKMLTGLTLAPAQHVQTPWLLKLDTDAVATGPSDWPVPAWFQSHPGGSVPVLVAPPWGYTRPSTTIDRLEEWADQIPELNSFPRLNIPPAQTGDRRHHPRITSWCAFIRTDWLRAITRLSPERLPVPSHDTFLWYCAARCQEFIRKIRMTHQGWRHPVHLQKWVTRSLDTGSRVTPTPSGAPSPDVQSPSPAGSLLRVLGQAFPAGPLRGAEVGVATGGTAAALLNAYPALHLHLIDPWQEYACDHPYRVSGDRCARRNRNANACAALTTLQRTGFAAARRTIWTEESILAATRLTDASLDFVFLDADHTYPAVQADLQAWWPKIRPGGVFVGHDYQGRRDRRGIWGVRRAVEEWAACQRLTVTVTQNHVWSVQKPVESPLTAVYLLTGVSHAARLVVSLVSLRRYHRGPIVLYTSQPESHRIGEQCAADLRLRVEHRVVSQPRLRRNATFVLKTQLPLVVPEETALFLDADTMVTGDLAPLAAKLDASAFVATQFANWRSTTRPIRKRVERWRTLAPQFEPDAAWQRRMDRALEPHPAINSGVFAWRKGAPILEDWARLTRLGHRLFIPDEVALQILLPDYPHAILDQRFNCSPRFGAYQDDVRIWHFHGDRHEKPGPGRDRWFPEFQSCWHADYAGMQSRWSDSVIERDHRPAG
ncbi:MAG: class I SAM-dependent methyltransferase [Bacteroidales bacterium]|nr:class I SAM-dependent methyltransferase [Bacteroidales bacterium]